MIFKLILGTTLVVATLVPARASSVLSPIPSWRMFGFGQFRGTSVASAGDVDGDGFGDVIIGVPGNEAPPEVFFGAPAGLALWHWSDDSINGYAPGMSVSSAGDVNDDGFDDIVFNEGGEGAPHRVFVYHGSATGPGIGANRILNLGLGNQSVVSAAGDVNGDGYDDVLLGLDRRNPGADGIAWVYYGSPAGLGAAPAWTVQGGQANSLYGHSVASAGDVNGDGYDDVIVGAPGLVRPAMGTGWVDVYHGSASGLSSTPDWTAGPGMGFAVSWAGDVNGDGFDDVIVRTPGGAAVYHGSLTGLSTTPDRTLIGDYRNVSNAGDVDADGYGDVLVAEVGADDGTTYLFPGSATGVVPSSAWMASEGSNFGFSIATAGDVNGDGGADVVVGAPGYPNSGQAFVYHGIVPFCPAGPGSDEDDDLAPCSTDNCRFTPNTGQEDSDLDGVGDPCDTCPSASNPLQGSAVFGQILRADSRDVFSWPTPVDVVAVRGPLSAVSFYFPDVIWYAVASSSVTDASEPPPGEGFYYLVKPLCAIGSWQSTPGAEPGRDASNLP